MNLSLLPDLISTNGSLTPASHQLLLERAMEFAQQNNYFEAALTFAIIGNEFSGLYPELKEHLEALAQNLAAYRQTQQALIEASRRLAELGSVQQSQVNEIIRSLTAFPPFQSTDRVAQPYLIPNSALPSDTTVGEPLPALYATCFGRFEIRRMGQVVDLCNNRNGQAVLRYLIIQPEHRESMQVLMSVLWPEDDTETARRKLRVAVSALRRSLNQGYDCPSGEGYILYKNDYYQLNPAVSIQTDVAEFLSYYQFGKKASLKDEIAGQYEAACRLYNGCLLTEDLYADWSFIQREQLNQYFISMCRTLTEFYLDSKSYEAAIRWATRLVGENRCDELAHRQLIRTYTLSGQRSLALKQYHYCRRVLEEELGVEPMPETEQLFYAVLNNEI